MGSQQIGPTLAAPTSADPCPDAATMGTGSGSIPAAELSSSLLNAMNEVSVPTQKKSQVAATTTAASDGDVPSLFSYAYGSSGTDTAVPGAADSKALWQPGASQHAANLGSATSDGQFVLADAAVAVNQLHYPMILDHYREVKPPSYTYWGTRLSDALMAITAAVVLVLILFQSKLRALWNRCEASVYGARRIIEVDEVDIQSCLSIESLVRGAWTPELVHQMLGRPDYVVLDPQGRNEPLRFFDRNRVAATQASPGFKRHLARLDAENARAAAKIRKWMVLCQLESIASATNPVAPVSDVRRDTQAALARPVVPIASQ